MCIRDRAHIISIADREKKAFEEGEIPQMCIRDRYSTEWNR